MTTSIQLVDIIQSLGIILTLMVAIWQMSVQTRHVRAASELALLVKFDDLTKLWIDNPGLWSQLDTTYIEGQSENSLEILENIMFMVFNTFELVFRHHKKYRLVENDAWIDWINNIQSYREKPYFDGWWMHNAHQYSNDFQSYVNSLPATSSHPQ
ncbi:hypothetical protein LCGC14_0479110 [marine sediment metagenome]|uniref:Uncharacterized protein n=1 Tax=marine sediment metagenome TaxID=412755 RepID=A0A0F9UWW0_9ZZZZ